jgi:hypothetical protein
MAVRICKRVIHDVAKDRSSEFTLVHSLRNLKGMGYPVQRCPNACFLPKQPMPIGLNRTSMIERQIMEFKE